MIKCVMLNAHCTLISEIVEVDAELGNPNCKLVKPYVYNSIDRVHDSFRKYIDDCRP